MEAVIHIVGHGLDVVFEQSAFVQVSHTSASPAMWRQLVSDMMISSKLWLIKAQRSSYCCSKGVSDIWVVTSITIDTTYMTLNYLICLLPVQSVSCTAVL